MLEVLFSNPLFWAVGNDAGARGAGSRPWVVGSWLVAFRVGLGWVGLGRVECSANCLLSFSHTAVVLRRTVVAVPPRFWHLVS